MNKVIGRVCLLVVLAQSFNQALGGDGKEVLAPESLAAMCQVSPMFGDGIDYGHNVGDFFDLVLNKDSVTVLDGGFRQYYKGQKRMRLSSDLPYEVQFQVSAVSEGLSKGEMDGISAKLIKDGKHVLASFDRMVGHETAITLDNIEPAQTLLDMNQSDVNITEAFLHGLLPGDLLNKVVISCFIKEVK